MVFYIIEYCNKICYNIYMNKTKGIFKVEIRSSCKKCGGVIAPYTRFRTFCSGECRNKFYNKKYAKRQAQWQRNTRNKKHSVSNGKDLRCPICSRYYIQLITHIIQVHKIDNATFRHEYNLPIKVGIVPKWYKELKGDIAIKNKTYKNIVGNGAIQYVKGDIRSKTKTGWKSTGGKDWREGLE